ncbi:MAG: tRNA (adenosine(37)-N6)-threonylcarbamoyltransferase complex dimerization subunit type 1 TsaB [Alphaproteobacteria bacterium]|nr:tRNA (adenosine(37)-N6)-threonylcarbamoyltransferase complex dimerization subunit type 1 TsaB [Alphaproteobacteria bacterium]
MAVALGIDASGAACSVSLTAWDGQMLIARQEFVERGHATHMMPMIAEVLGGRHDVGAIAVGIGPGSFTGLRVALAAARGIALARAIPCLGVDGFRSQRAALPPDIGPVTVVLDARPMAVPGDDPKHLPMVQRFSAEGIAVHEPRLEPVDALIVLGTLVGQRIGSLAARLNAPAIELGPVRAEIVAALGLADLAAGRVVPARPLYLRAPDVSVARPTGVKR